MLLKSSFALIVLLLFLSGCAADSQFDTEKAVQLGAGALQATMLDEQSVMQAAALTAKELDARYQVAAANSPYTTRLRKLTANMHNYDGLRLNFKVYISKDVNAFAMADGTIRVHSALMDLMPDDQVLSVISHEIGHVKLKHSYQQMKENMLTNLAFEAVSSMGGAIGALSASQLGALAQGVVSARFSQSDELEADTYAVRALKQLGRDPYAMKRSIETLQRQSASNAGFLSSHPSNQKRIENIQTEIRRL